MADPERNLDRVSAWVNPEGNTPRRRRSFVAGTRSPEKPAESAEIPILPLPTIEDDDLPVLTEVVPDEQPEPPPAAEPAKPERDDEALLAIIADDLVRTLETQLAIELPTLIEATLIGAQAELRNGINSTLEMALRDFLARRRQLRLPLNDPNNDPDNA